MNRRNFFKVVTGFVAGAVAAIAPKAKAKLRDFDAHLVLGDDFDEVDLFDTKKHPSCYGYFRSAGALDCSVDCEFTEECSCLGQVPEDVIYYFPTTQKFSKTRFTQLID